MIDIPEYLMSIQASMNSCMVALVGFAHPPTFLGSVKITRLFYQPLVVIFD